MDSISINRFQDNLKTYIEQVITTHTPLNVTHRTGEDFIVMSANDWEREKETLYVLQNSRLMQQIAESLSTHLQGQGYKPTESEIDESLSV